MEWWDSNVIEILSFSPLDWCNSFLIKTLPLLLSWLAWPLSPWSLPAFIVNEVFRLVPRFRLDSSDCYSHRRCFHPAPLWRPFSFCCCPGGNYGMPAPGLTGQQSGGMFMNMNGDSYQTGDNSVRVCAWPPLWGALRCRMRLAVSTDEWVLGDQAATLTFATWCWFVLVDCCWSGFIGVRDGFWKHV